MAVSSLVFTATLHVYLRASWQAKHTAGISDLEPSQSLAGTGALTGIAAELSQIENGERQKTLPVKQTTESPGETLRPSGRLQLVDTTVQDRLIFQTCNQLSNIQHRIKCRVASQSSVFSILNLAVLFG